MLNTLEGLGFFLGLVLLVIAVLNLLLTLARISEIFF